jgi:hypothetical protein
MAVTMVSEWVAPMAVTMVSQRVVSVVANWVLRVAQKCAWELSLRYPRRHYQGRGRIEIRLIRFTRLFSWSQGNANEGIVSRT